MMYFTSQTQHLTDEQKQRIITDVTAALHEEFGDELLHPDGKSSRRIRSRINSLTSTIARRYAPSISGEAIEELAQTLANQLLGLGFLEPLLEKAARGDFIEIMLNPDGSVWAVPAGQVHPVRIEGVSPTRTEAFIVVNSILANVGRRLTEAEPIVVAFLPQSERFPAGARVNVVGPPIVVGKFPALNIRFFTREPVTRELLVEKWKMLSDEMADFLSECIRNRLRVMIAGGTGVGKTTLASFLANQIPPEHRIILIENPPEIFIDRPHVVRMTSRPPSLDGRFGVSVGDLVTTALRMFPFWLIVGEVRDGMTGMWLLRAQMSDHPGLSTIHAQSTKAAVETLVTLHLLDAGVKAEATKRLFLRAVDIMVQLGYDQAGIRRVTRIAQVQPELHRGEVYFDDIFRFDYGSVRSPADEPMWERTDVELIRTRE